MTSRTSRWLALLGLVLTLATPAAVDAHVCSACGANGQPACCIFDGCGGACEPGNTEVSGCSGSDCGCSISRCFTTRTCAQCGGDGEPGCCLFEGCGFVGCATDVTVTGCSGTDCGCSSNRCYDKVPCGGAGQRACCVIEGTAPCGGGLVEFPRCSGFGACLCGDIAGIAVFSSGTCGDPQCGGPGQRGCCIGADRAAEGLSGPCQPGLVEDLQNGCSGDCQCGGQAAGVKSLGTCVDPMCGGEGERACCLVERVPSCDPGLIEVPGCAGDCSCVVPGIPSSGTCVKPSPCGGAGQRACCVVNLEASTPCQAGLSEVPGCTGDCFCGGTGTGQSSSSSCVLPTTSIAEPDTGWSVPEGYVYDPFPLRGFADLHLHMFANLAHGGRVLAGAPYDPDEFSDNPVRGINKALAAADDDAIHGGHGLDDPVGFGTKDPAVSNYGAPGFTSWPTWSSTTHQQVYYRWLERAWRGGMRLAVVFAVTNEALCKGTGGSQCEDSMAAIDAQIQAAYDFQAFVDQQFGGPGTGWFRIVTSSAEARSVILQRKLAVVLGIEVDNLFDCKFGQCTADFVRQQLQTYYDKGVRHVFPVHNFDNAYGSPSIFLGAINVGNRVSEGRYFEVEDCGPSGYGFKLVASVMNFFISLFKFGIEPPPIYPDYPHCNLLGLSSLGQELVTEMMNKGMIIDVDHMSLKTLDRVLELAEARSYPVVASHVLFYDLYTPERRHERMRTAAQLDRIRNVGGMVAAMLKDDAQDTDDVGQKFTVQYGNVADDCRYSSKTWAQAYRYAVDKMGGPVAFGSDFNGIAGHLGPRFGSHACGSDALERSTQARAANQLAYPFRDGLFFGYGQFDRQITGQRAFDFNVDGLAHIGLLPDLVADLQRIGLNATDLEPLFQSANAYVEMWGRAEAATPRTPCGGAGQRACCAAERTPSCDPGLDAVPGCSGDCVCAIGGSSVSTCVPSVTTTSAPSSSTTVTLTSSTSTTVTITPPASTTSTSAPSAASTTTTLPACRTLRCLIDAARRGPHCGDETLPPSVTNKLDRAIQMAELAPGQTPKKTKRLYTSARRLLAKAGKAATKAARGSRPKLTAECAADLRDAIARAIGTLGT